MSMRCDLCGKEPSFGNRVSRTGRKAIVRRVRGRSSRRFDPNIQNKRAVVNGTSVRMKACTSCIKKGRVVLRSAQRRSYGS